MKRTAAILTVLLLISLSLSACKPVEANPPQIEAPDDIVTISIPEFLNEIGETLNTLKNDHPDAEILVRNDGLPEAAAVCLGESEAKYVYYFVGAQDGNFEEVMDEYGDQLKCAGFLTTAGVLFPEMEDDISFSDFFSLIGVSDYEYFSDEGQGQGWISFKYDNMDVLLNTNKANANGGWDFTGIERVKRSAPVAIFDREINKQNFQLANSVMFD